MTKHILLIATALFLSAQAALAGPVLFNEGWTENRFSLFSKNRYSFGETELGIVSRKSVSLTYTALPEQKWDSMSAAWSWRVEQSVPVTDLSVKGGDDRNISLFVVFLPEADAQALKGKKVTRLLRNRNVRVLTYVWGGDHGRGTILDSPYLKERGKTVVLRDAGAGAFSEMVDLHADYQRAFGGLPETVVGLAVSADSDDTRSTVRAAISDFHLK